MRNIEKTALLVSTALLLNGCFSGEFNDDYTPTPVNNDITPEVSSLFALANNFPIGVAVPAGDADNSIIARDELQTVVNKHFNQITAENIMKPGYLQPNEGDFYFDDADALIAYAQNNNISIHGHTLVWHEQSPQWMQACADATACEDILETHITTIVQQYADSIDSWDVVNEAFYNNGEYRDEDQNGEKGSFWFRKLGKDYISKAFIAARLADDDAELYYNDYATEQNNAKLDALIAMVNELKTAGTDGSSVIDGIGFQMHVQADSPSIADISASFKKAVATGLKVKITELDVQMNVDGSATTFTAELATAQQLRYQEIVTAYLTIVPSEQRGGISVWGVSDADSWIPYLYNRADWPLLFDADLKQKPALQGFADALKTETPALSSLFNYDFTDDVQGWISNTYNNAPEATISHNTDGNIDVVLAAEGQHTIEVALDEAITVSAGMILKVDVKMPGANVTAGDMTIQPFLQDGDYVGIYPGDYADFSADEWTTIEITLTEEQAASVNDIKTVGLQIKSTNSNGTAGNAIQVDNIVLVGVTQEDDTSPEDDTTEPDPDNTAYVLNYDFADSEQGWASNTYGDAPEATITHNATDEHIDVVLAAEGQHTIQVALDEAITVSAGMVLEVDVKMPAANVTAGDMTIQPFLQDGNYAGIYPGDYADFTADTWTTIKVTLTAEQANSVEEITTVGLQIKSANSNGTSDQAIQIDNIRIVK